MPDVRRQSVTVAGAGHRRQPGGDALPPAELAELIRPAGYFNIKANRLRAFLKVLIEDFGGSLTKLMHGPTPLVRERLLAVNGIGPKVALAVLSGIAPPDLVAAVQGNEPARLTTIPGIGRKTAERIVLELRDRLPAALPASVEISGPGGAVRADLASALINLGYPRPSVEKAVGDVLKAHPTASFDDALRQALGRLARA